MMRADSKSRFPSFQQSAVTSSMSVVKESIDLKTASCFYDQIIIMDYKHFRPSLEETLGPDLIYLVDKGLVIVEPYDKQLDIEKGQKAYGYAESIRSYMAASIFTPAEEVEPIYEVAGNGMARLYAAMSADSAATGQRLIPIVSGRTNLDGFEANLERNPLPTQVELEELLPVRTTATEALFDLIPVPTRQVPWDDVLEFRDRQDTGLYAARIRILLERLGKETDRRHVEDLIRSEFASFEDKLGIFKRQRTLTSFKAVLPWGDFLHDLLKGILLLKPGQAARALVATSEKKIEIMKAEQEITADPYYMIEHVRSSF